MPWVTDDSGEPEAHGAAVSLTSVNPGLTPVPVERGLRRFRGGMGVPPDGRDAHPPRNAAARVAQHARLMRPIRWCLGRVIAAKQLEHLGMRKFHPALIEPAPRDALFMKKIAGRADRDREFDGDPTESGS